MPQSTFLNYHVKQKCTDDIIPYLQRNNNNKKEIRCFVTMTQSLPYPTWVSPCQINTEMQRPSQTWYLHSVTFTQTEFQPHTINVWLLIRAIQKWSFLAHPLLQNTIISNTYQLHHVVAHKSLFHLIYLRSISYNFEVRGHCYSVL